TSAAANVAAALAAAEEVAFCIARVVKYQAATSEPRPAKPTMPVSTMASITAAAPRRSRINWRMPSHGAFSRGGNWGRLLAVLPVKDGHFWLGGGLKQAWDARFTDSIVQEMSSDIA